jgi:hypothetical protein
MFMSRSAFPAKDRVLVVQPGRWHQRDEELGSVGVGARIRHTQGVGSRGNQGNNNIFLWPCNSYHPIDNVLK